MLSGKVAVVTGAGSGIGRGAATALPGAGAQVVLNDVVADGLDETLAGVHRAGTEGVVSVGDVRVRADVQRLVATAVSAFGGVDVMFANAAISRYLDFENMSEDDIDLILDIDRGLRETACKAAGSEVRVKRHRGCVALV